jgi:D-alanyl-D-alanine carboxypeptidase
MCGLRSLRCLVSALFSFAILCALSACAATPEKIPTSQVAAQQLALEQSVETALQGILKETRVPGGIVAYSFGDGEVHIVSGGFSDQELGLPMKPTDRLLSGSTGKSFVAAAALTLVEEGKLSLDAPISEWVGSEPWFSQLPNADLITLRQLLMHRSGLADHVYIEAFYPMIMEAPGISDPNSRDKREEVLSLVFDAGSLFAPGDGYAYTDTGYYLIGLIVENATGRSLYDEISERVLKKLDMDATTPSDRRSLTGLVPGYLGKDNPFGMPERVVNSDGELVYNNALEWAGGGFATNPHDLVLFARGAFRGDLLSEPYRKLMLDGQPTKEGRPYPRYGLGVGQKMTDYGVAYGHTGWIPGYVSFVGYLPEEDITVAFQFNAAPSGEIQDPIPLAKERILKLLVEKTT